MDTKVPENKEGDRIRVGDIKHAQAVAIGEGATAVYQGLTAEEVAALVVELKNKDQPTVWNGRIPYLGLSAYQEADARYFFGRESLVQELLQRVQEANFITIAGPSGSGKSSVARAGLFHALRQGIEIENSDRWLLATMQPKGDPFAQLATAMEKATKSTAVGDVLKPKDKTFPTTETLLRRSYMHLSDENGRCVLLVDQFEELFTQTKDPQQRQAFIDLLTQASQDPESHFTVIISLRSDFVSNCASYEKLRELISQQFQLVGAMASHDLAKAITLPALEVGTEIDPRLVSQIIADMKGSPDALPLMSFALRDLFEGEKTDKGKPMDLTLPGYVQRGGLEKALEEHANKVFNNFTDEQQEIAKNIFPKLIEVGQGHVDTRRTATFAELVPIGSSAEAVTTVLIDLADMRLVTTSDLAAVEGKPIATGDQEATVTIAHEKMIDAWPWLRNLVDENRDLIALQNQINNDAQDWAKNQDEGFLYRSGRLLQVEEKLELIKPHLDVRSLQFIQASLERREQEQQEAEANRQREEDLKSQKRIGRILRWATGIVGILLIIAIILAVQAASDREDAINAQATSDVNAKLANDSEIEARNAEGTAVFAQATSDVNARLANESAIEARNAEVTAVAAQATSDVNASLASTREAEALVAEAEVRELKDVIQANQLAQLAILEVDDDPAMALLMALASFRLSQQPNTYSSLIITLQTHDQIILSGHEDWVRSATFSPDGDQIVTASVDGTARIWDIAGNELAVLSGHEDEVRSATFSRDGKRIVTASIDRTARIWDMAGNELKVLSGHEGEFWSATFSPDGEHIVTTSVYGTAQVWDVAGNKLAVLSGHEGLVYSATFSPDGERIVTASADGTARVWDVAGNELKVLSGHEDGVWSATFSPNGERIVTASADRTARVWDVAGNELAVLSEHEGLVHSATFSPDGERIVTASVDRTARIWDEAGNELTVLSGHEATVFSATFSPDGERIVTASVDGTARVWSSYSVEYIVSEAYDHLYRGFYQAECQQYFRDDLAACPRSKQALFEPLVQYLTPEQQADWQSLEE